MPIVLPFYAIYYTGKKMFSDNSYDEQSAEDKLQNINIFKMFEHFGEALPQLILSCVYIHNNGGPYTHPFNTTSAVLSAGSLAYGVFNGIRSIGCF